jgi:hypothetical protein
MATYNKDNFVIPVGDNIFLKLRDKDGIIRHTFYHNSISSFFVSNTNIIIKTVSDNNTITLDFPSNTDALHGLVKLKSAYSLVKKNYDKQKTSCKPTPPCPPEPCPLPPDTEINLRRFVFSDEPDANDTLVDGQTAFSLPSEARIIQSVSINGVLINDYSFDSQTNILIIIPSLIGYGIEEDDELMIKYFI